MSEIAVKIENLSKQYRLGLVGTNTLKGDMQAWWYRVRGKEDPTLKIGEENKLDKTGGEHIWALKDISLEIKKGEILGIIGKNGAGKSTLLKILSRVTGPTTGSVKVDGRLASLLEVGTGFHPELTGRENIFLNGAILGMTKPEINKEFDAIVDFAGIAKFIDTPVKRYSSGMYVRLGFAVAAHLRSEILVVDEVLAVGDAEFQKKAIGKMQDISAGQGRTVLFVSHNMASVRNLCTRGILLDKGVIAFTGNADDVITHYIFSNFKSKKQSYNAKNKKDIYINIIKLRSDKNNVDFNKDIVFDIEIKDNLKIKSFYVGLAVLNQKGSKIFTTISPKLLKAQETYNVNVTIPRKTLLAGDYSVDVAVFIPGGETYDYVNEQCLFSVIDNSSDLAYFSSNNIGNVNIICTWD